MNNGLETRYFLSALTGAGYYALHRQFLRPPERYFCILKGGPEKLLQQISAEK